jgi:Spy/CpxP family protein refolding chaperone
VTVHTIPTTLGITMNNFRKNVLIGLTVLGMGSAIGAQAQDTPDGRHANAATQEQRQAKMAEFQAKRFARLHDELKITPAQENAFRAYVSAMQPKPMAKGERSNFKEMTAPQRAEQMIAMQKQRTAEMEAHLPALNALYAVLSPEQKKTLDQVGMHHHGHGGHGWGGRQG